MKNPPPLARGRSGTPPRHAAPREVAPLPAAVGGAGRSSGAKSPRHAGEIANTYFKGPGTDGKIDFDMNSASQRRIRDPDEVAERAPLAPVVETKKEDGPPELSPMVVRLNMACSLSLIVALVIYISLSDTTSDGLAHEERGAHAWRAEVDNSSQTDVACFEAYYKFVRLCEPTVETADDQCYATPDASGFCGEGCHIVPAGTESCDWATGDYANGVCTAAGACSGCPAGCTVDEARITCSGVASASCQYDPFRTCTRAACNDRGDCVNAERCACDAGWAGAFCKDETNVISIAGREFGGCPTSTCTAADLEATGVAACPNCQVVLDDLLHICVDGDVEWFHDMEDDVRLPSRAEELGCVLKGQMSEHGEGETVFEDLGLLPEFLLSFLATVYLCYALALLCEDFFVSALDIIVEKLGLPADVAGATFMAAGSSAPELFVSAAGVFITHSPVGVGACAGSTMFNTMCIIGGSALIAGKPVPLQWRSIVRDCGIYIVSLVALFLMLMDGRIEGWESIVLLAIYVFYIVLCAVWGKLVTACCPGNSEKIKEADDAADIGELSARAAEEKIDLLRESRRAVSSKLKGAANQVVIANRLRLKTDLANSTTNLLKKDGTADVATPVAVNNRRATRQMTMELTSMLEVKAHGEHGEDGHGEHDEHHEHPGLCDIPEGSAARLFWLISFPLMFIFTITVPNCSKYPKVFPLTFVSCIVWLGILVEMMVEHASEFGALLGFSPGILGLTLLAAGTSFPDLVASLIVAKKGEINMAVSNAFGSNNFDILLCLGLPWLLSIYAVTGRAEVIDTAGINAALISLIVTTCIWFFYMAATKWVLTPGVGLTMLTTYATWLLCQLILDMFAPQAHE